MWIKNNKNILQYIAFHEYDIQLLITDQYKRPQEKKSIKI